jgi:hypothetical protein
MSSQSVQTIKAIVPGVADLKELFPHYVAFAEGEGRVICETVYSPLGFELARCATLNGLPAVAGVTDLCDRAQPGWGWTPFSKQFLGGLVRVLMAVNQYSPTGTKRLIPHPAFNRGEVYSLSARLEG